MSFLDEIKLPTRKRHYTYRITIDLDTDFDDGDPIDREAKILALQHFKDALEVGLEDVVPKMNELGWKIDYGQYD